MSKPIRSFWTTEHNDGQDCDFCLADCCIQRVDVYMTPDLEESWHVIHNDASEVMGQLN